MRSAAIDSSFPKMDASSAVYPTVRVDDAFVYLAYHLPGCVDSAVVAFSNVSDGSYGPPNDEGLRSHPLWGHGLTAYNFHSVRPSRSPEAREWVATFHDGTFTVIATSCLVEARHVAAKSPSEALDELLGAGRNHVLDELP